MPDQSVLVDRSIFPTPTPSPSGAAFYPNQVKYEIRPGGDSLSKDRDGNLYGLKPGTAKAVAKYDNGVTTITSNEFAVKVTTEISIGFVPKSDAPQITTTVGATRIFLAPFIQVTHYPNRPHGGDYTLTFAQKEDNAAGGSLSYDVSMGYVYTPPLTGSADGTPKYDKITVQSVYDPEKTAILTIKVTSATVGIIIK